MCCMSCGSGKETEFPAEINIHFPWKIWTNPAFVYSEAFGVPGLRLLAFTISEQWTAEDQDINRKLAELRKKYGTPPTLSTSCGTTQRSVR